MRRIVLQKVFRGVCKVLFRRGIENEVTRQRQQDGLLIFVKAVLVQLVSLQRFVVGQVVRENDEERDGLGEAIRERHKGHKKPILRV